MNNTTEISLVEKFEKAAVILKTVAHPARLAIIQMLKGGKTKMSVNEICEALEMEQSLVSHHLNNMKLRGILACERDGKQILYHLKEKDVYKVINCIESCNCNM
ncbi:MAG: metalloregulator ArsR/SmtB family transcription factor [Chitinophagales bacterium]